MHANTWYREVRKIEDRLTVVSREEGGRSEVAGNEGHVRGAVDRPLCR